MLTISCKSLFRSAVVSAFAAMGTFAVANEPVDLETILKKEAAGELVQRASAAEDSHVTPFAAWQAGKIRQGDEWRSYNEQIESKKESQYLAKRDELKKNPQRHFLLAKWCVLHQLNDQARAHYYGVLMTEPDNSDARKYLGHVRVGDDWVDAGLLATSQKDIKRKIDSLEDWVPRIGQIVEDLQSGNAKRMSKGLKQLDGIDSSAAMSALEVFATNIDDDLAKPLVVKIASIRSRDACSALVRIALFNASAETHSVAADAIRKYPME
ncbi:MAG: hypothetical protein ABL921_29675, partial [Pirellula sp.]